MNGRDRGRPAVGSLPARATAIPSRASRGTLTRFWGWGDNLEKHWIEHRANHANFLARHHVTQIGGESVPFSVTSSERVCSSCAEIFNVVADDSRKLVNACPGSVTFGGAARDTWVDVKPLGRSAGGTAARADLA